MMESGREGKQIFELSGGKGEYFAVQMILSFVSGTLCFGCGLVLFACMRFGDGGGISVALGIREMTGLLLVIYLAFLAVYIFFSYRILRRRYRAIYEKRSRYMKEADALYASLTEENLENGSDTED